MSQSSSSDKKKASTPSSEVTSSNESTSEQKRTSFDEAGKGLIDEEDNKRMEEMGDFDSNPDYSSDNINKMREAIRARTSEMGLEKSKLSKELIKDANERAKAGENVQGLDLTKIRGSIPEDMPTMLYDPEEEMTENEKKEVDPVGQESIINQAKNELQNAKWPNFAAATREVAITLLVVAVTGVIIIYWDQFLRGFYQDIGMVPRAEDVELQFDGLELPEGWSNTNAAVDSASSSLTDL